MRTANSKNKLGQEIGARGALTRQGLLQATSQLLDQQSPLELSVHAIAREAGSSPATFYVYFTDVKDAIFALVETLNEDFTASVLPLLQGPWPRKQVKTRVQAFVEANYAFWDRHRRLLVVRNLEADLGDRRFFSLRIDMNMPALNALAERILEQRGTAENLSMKEAFAQAVVSCAAMEELFSHAPENYREDHPIAVTDIIQAEIDTICRALGLSTRRNKACA
ncbi:TetR/AcrR family transcriptional regulator [Pseudomonas sp. LB3P14]